jgi:hypothetical protein
MRPNLLRIAGQRLRDDLEVTDTPSGYATLRQRLVQRAQADRVRRRRAQRLVVVGACVAATLLVWFGGPAVLDVGEPPELAFFAGDAAETGRVGAYYTARMDTPLSLRFVEGSSILLDLRGGLRVSSAQSPRVSVQLETGAAHFDIVPRRDRQWEVLAGPYLVRVTGTAFWLSWDVTAQTLDLRMRSGKVIVSGPGIESGQEVKGTERFVTQVSTSRSSAAPLPTQGAARAVERPATSVEGLTEGTPTERRRLPDQRSINAAGRTPGTLSQGAGRARNKSEAVEPSGVEAGQGVGSEAVPAPSPKPAEAVAAVEPIGVDQVLSSASAERLLSLADTERFAGRTDIARRALQAVRSRFGGGSAAANAAFLLGRMADDGGRPRDAITWYDTHARESGQLVPEALGRKMLALHRLGEIAQRDRVAAEYLERFPQGAYARQARELLSH